MSSRILGVIPARRHSTRIPQKMLADIGGIPLIARTIERTKKAKSLEALVVSTDSDEIEKIATSCGVQVVRTASDIQTGTDRVAATVKLFKEFEPEIVVNIWGDEPFFPAEVIDAVAQMMQGDKDLQVACAADRIEESQLAEPSMVKVAIDTDGYARTFSRSPILGAEPYHVIGVMAMRTSFLDTYAQMPQTESELREGIEQLRLIEHGVRIKIHKGSYGSIGVNTPADLETARAKMSI